MGWQLTNTHDDEEASEEPAKVEHSTTCRLHEVIVARGPSAQPVGEWCDDVGRHDEQREEVAVEGGGEDDEEKAYCQDLPSAWVSGYVQ